MILWGKLAGFVIGAFSGMGIYGVIIGVILGHFVDMYLTYRKLKSASTGFFLNPSGVSLQERDFFLMASSGLSAFVSNIKTENADYARELIAGVLRVHLSLQGKETESVKDYVTAYLNTEDPDIEGILREYAESKQDGKANIALISALFRIEEQTGITGEKTRFIRKIAGLTEIPEEEFYGIRRHFLGVSLENYEILGLPVEATTDEIRKTYRNLVAFFHPDGASMLSEEQKQESSEAFIAIKRAYESIMKERAGD